MKRGLHHIMSCHTSLHSIIQKRKKEKKNKFNWRGIELKFNCYYITLDNTSYMRVVTPSTYTILYYSSISLLHTCHAFQSRHAHLWVTLSFITSHIHILPPKSITRIPFLPDLLLYKQYFIHSTDTEKSPKRTM